MERKICLCFNEVCAQTLIDILIIFVLVSIDMPLNLT